MAGKYQAYSDYKNNGSKWFGNLPGHWAEVPLKFQCTYNDEVLPESLNDDYEIEYVDIGSVSPSEGIKKLERMPFGKAPSRARRIARDGDVIVSTVRTYLEAIAPIKSPPENLVVSTGFAVVRPRDCLCKDFAAYALRAKGFIEEVVARSVGVSYPAINASELVSIYSPVPSLVEQEKIANFLDHETAKIDTLIDKQQLLIKLLKEKRQAVISHAVTKGLNSDAPMKDSGIEWLGEVPEHWEVVRVKQISNYITSGPRGWSDFINEEGKDIFLQSGDLNNEQEILPQKAKKVIAPQGAEGVRTKLRKGDVVVCITGANTGRVAVVESLPTTTYINQHLSLIRPIQNKINSKFIGYALSSQGGRSYFDLTQYGLKEGLSLSNVAEAPLAFPPLGEQIEIVEVLRTKLRSFSKVIRNAEVQIDLLQERRSALISATVTGKIDVRNWEYRQ